MCAVALSLRRQIDSLGSLAHLESITDAYSQYFVDDIEHTENYKQGQKCKLSLLLSLEQVIVSFYMVFPYLIISAERTA